VATLGAQAQALVVLEKPLVPETAQHPAVIRIAAMLKVPLHMKRKLGERRTPEFPMTILKGGGVVVQCQTPKTEPVKG
jgi:hypothetical protein